MTTPATIGVDKGSTLANTNQILAEQEAVLGPLIGMGNDGTQTTLTFETEQNSPAKNAVIATDSNSKPVVPAGSKLVCSGKIYIAGTLTAASATRPN